MTELCPYCGGENTWLTEVIPHNGMQVHRCDDCQRYFRILLDPGEEETE